MRNSSVIGRSAAIGAIVLAIVVIAYVLVSSGSGYQVKALFQDAGQIVSGDQVEIAGNSVGTVSSVSLTPSGLADLTLSISDSTFQPLHAGTQATVRAASLSGIANRYVALTLGPNSAPKIPNNGTIPTADTTSAVDVDQIFNTLDPKTRKGLQDVFQGSASQYAGQGQKAQAAWAYLNPAIASSSMLFQEIDRDTGQFTNFLVKSGNLLSDIATRQSDVSGLVSNLSTTFSALASQNIALGQSIQRLPGFMALADTTFVNLRSALDDLTPLVNDTKPVAPKLQHLLEVLKPLAINAQPTVRDLSNIISKPGPDNDLIDLNELAVPLAKVTVGNVQANGKTRPGAFIVATKSLNQSTPELAVGRPYAVDLTGWFEGYSHPGGYDANGGYSRVAPVIGLGSVENGALNFCSAPVLSVIPGCSSAVNLLTNPGSRLAFANSVLTTGQGDRCPGSMERGAVYYPESGYPCNPSEVPTGP